MSNILLVEDEAHLAQGLRFNLEAEGHSVDVVGTGEEALLRLMSADRQIDVAVLDVMLPGIDGFAVVRELRKARRFLPVLVLTALNRPEDVLQGFASGADDYLPKPFDLKILLARVSSLLRRRAWQSEQVAASQMAAVQAEVLPTGGPDATFEFSDIIVDFHALEVRTRAGTFQLTVMEADLLRYLVRNRGQAVSRKQILGDVWGLPEDTDTRAIDNFVVRLRRYIEPEPSRPRYLLTVRGVGYKLVAQPSVPERP
jgi:two-component system, OmpR family, alkaline phosphatase synthesis response regulator PhoP